MQQTFEHFLNTATVMKSPKPLSISIFDYLKRFDSGLRQIIICFNSFLRIEAFFHLQGILIRNVKILRENSTCYISDTYVTAKIL